MPGRQSNFIGIYDDALSPEFCELIVERFESSTAAHETGRIGSGVDTSKKDSVDCCISEYREWTDINQQIFNITLAYLSKYVREHPFLVSGAIAPTVQLENGDVAEITPDIVPNVSDQQLGGIILSLYRPGYLNLQKYLKGMGGYHHWHSEIYPREKNCESLHRVLLFMFFLNSVDDGGETEFYYQDRKIRPRVGRMVIAPAGFTHTHKGCVPLSDDKYIITSWIKFQRAEQIFSQSR